MGVAKTRALTDEQADQIRDEYRKGDPYKVIAAKYGVSITAISYIINYKTYDNR